MPRRPSAGKDSVRELLVKTATRLIAERGFEAVSIQDIADEVGVTKQALLYHFKNKEALGAAVIDDVLERANVHFLALATGGTKGPARVDAILDHIQRYLGAEPAGATVILRFLVDGNEAAIERIKHVARPWFLVLEAELARAQGAGEIRKELDVETALLQIGMLALTNFALLPLGHWTKQKASEWKRRRLQSLVTAVELILIPDAKRR